MLDNKNDCYLSSRSMIDRHMIGNTVMTLWEAPAKHAALISHMDGGLSPLVAGRLREMGIDQGQPLLCLRRGPFNGAMVVQVGDCIYSLEQKIAEQIKIQAL